VGSTTTKLTIRKTENEFDMNGSYVEHIGGDMEFGGATARCVDIVPTAHWTFTFTGPTSATNSATNTITLRNNFPSGTPVPVANVGCFLTAISGEWIRPTIDPLGWNNGTFLIGDSKVSPNWQMTVPMGVRARQSALSSSAGWRR